VAFGELHTVHYLGGYKSPYFFPLIFCAQAPGERVPANFLAGAERGSKRITTTEFGQKFLGPSEKFELKESPFQGKPQTQTPQTPPFYFNK
jgi:hypothetical protein